MEKQEVWRDGQEGNKRGKQPGPDTDLLILEVGGQVVQVFLQGGVGTYKIKIKQEGSKINKCGQDQC